MRKSLMTLATAATIVAGVAIAPTLYAQTAEEAPSGAPMGPGMMGDQGGMMGMMQMMTQMQEMMGACTKMMQAMTPAQPPATGAPQPEQKG